MVEGYVRSGRSCFLLTMLANKRPRQDERKTKKQPLSCAECRRQVRLSPLFPSSSPSTGSSSRSSSTLPISVLVLTLPSATVSFPASPAQSAAARKYVQTVGPPLTPPPACSPSAQAHSPREKAAGQSVPPPPLPLLTPRQVHPCKHRAAPCKDNPDERSHTPARGGPWLPPG